ncbi:MAG: aminotransferase class I/II-fold pyridoxal phosphate-dependent enzyme [Patescibacteria group bacterium]|nr:aminotransferase class I/II-fold pyridoxal phosphate-dependent enzyme [Patescibacteria group bacterium]MDD5715861.1 aminotransferase class I/II-fold pyridoxal phosphate-dependent enzyme [Patescibacteria group bacterium]
MGIPTPPAERLNAVISNWNRAIFGMLSERGRLVYFPHEGILGQTAEAKGAELNATIGMACEDDGSIMALDSISKQLTIGKDSAFPYAPSFGNKKLRELWQAQVRQKNPSIVSETSIPIVTSALTHGLSIVGYLFMEPGIRVVIPEPFWGNYKLTFGVSYGAEIVTFPLFHDGRFNIEGLRETLQHSAAPTVVVLNFPNNPTGYSPTTAEANQIIETLTLHAVHHPLVVVCDDAYFGLVFEDGVYAESLFGKLAEASEQLLAVKADGCTKEDYVWGFRVGFVTFGCKGGAKELYGALEDKAAGAVRATISNAPNISQGLLLNAFSSPTYGQEKAEKRAALYSRYQEIKKIVEHHPEYIEYFKPLPYNSGYFMCVQLTDRLNAENVRKRLIEKHSTGVIAIGNLLRIAYSSVAREKLQRIFDNIFAACKEMAKG